MELITQFSKFNPTAMMSLNNSNYKADSLVNQNVAMTSTLDSDLKEALGLIEKIVAPASYNEPVSSQSVSALESLGEAYLASQITLQETESQNAQVDTAVTAEGPEAQVSAEKTMASQVVLVKETATSLEKVRTSVKNDVLQAKMTASELQGLNAEYQSANNERSSSAIDTSTSYADLWARIAVATSTIKSDYVDFYSMLMQKYTEMYEAYNETCQKASSSAITPGDDGNNVKFNTNTMQNGYNQYWDKLVDLEAKLGTIKNWGSMTTAERESMVATLAPAFAVENGNIYFNIDQYRTVKDTYPSGIDGGKVSTASYQAWLATFNAAGSAFQSNMQSFAQRYSQANSTFDNLNKVLSGAISSLADSAKEVLKSLG